MPLLQDPDASLSWEPDRVEMSQSGDLGYTYGRYQSRRKSSNGSTVVRTGKYVSIWRKEKDGRWRVALDIGSPDPSP
jgi:ketosteroid isomerase-like protein